MLRELGELGAAGGVAGEHTGRATNGVGSRRDF
jgi:hypothetical protein